MMHVKGTRKRLDTKGGSNAWTTVHFFAPGVHSLLCGRGGSNSYLESTDDPVTCKECWRAIQMIARDQLTNLSSAGVEKILDQIALMRNGDFKNADESRG